MYKTAKNLFLLSIIVAASIVSAISLPQTASAAVAGLYTPDKIKTQARQNALRNSLALCTTYEVTTIGSLGGTISMNTDGGDKRGETVRKSDIAAGNWYYDGDDEPKTRIGYMVDPDNGTVECRNLFKGRNVAKELGFDGNIELACAIGITRTNGSDCEDGTGDFTAATSSRDKIFKAIKAKTGVDGYTKAQLYVLAASTYMTACGGRAVINWDDASTDQKNNTEKYDKIKIVTGTGGIKEVLHTKKNNDGKAFRNLTDGDFSAITENCDWMKDRMNEYASDYAAWVKDGNEAPNGDEAGSNIDQDENEEEEEKTTCAVPGIGWIICPVINNLLAPVVDASYGYVSTLLEVQPLNTAPGTGNALYSAWSAMRDFANVAFVIAFLLIVFSQLTSVGITNYGLKKMLPRLIIAAILVNVSYWVCAIAVDLSNIAGSSMRGVFQGITNGLATPDYSDKQTGEGAAGWVGLSATLLVTAGAALYIGLSALVPALILVLFTILAVFIALAIRQALIILLIVVAPLAFVAYLLPNTEQLFSKWRKLFITLLIMYPIIGLIFGASELASKIVTDAAPSGKDVSDGYTMAFKIMGAMIAVVPLVVVPTMIKGAKAFGGMIGGRMGNVLNNPNKGPFDRVRKGAEGYRKNRQEYRGLKAMNGYRTLPGKGIASRMSTRREAVINNRRAEANRANAAYIANTAETNDSFRTKLAQGGGDGAEMRSLAGAINIQTELEAKEVKAASAVIEHMNLSSDQLNNIAKGNNVEKDGRTLYGSDEATRTAAIQSAVRTGTVGDVESLIQSAGTMSDTQRKALSTSIASSGIDKKATHLGGQTIDDIAQGNVTNEDDLNRVMARAIKGGKYSPEKLADNDKDSLKRMEAVLNAPTASTGLVQGDIDKLRTQANDVQNNDRLKTRVQDSAKPIMDRIKTNTPPPTPPPAPTPPSPPPTPSP